MKDLKYLAAYIIPALTLFGIYLGGIYTYLGVLFPFVLVPLLEPFLSQSTENLSKEVQLTKLKRRFFDVLLYLNLPVVFGLLIYFGYWINQGNHETYEYIGNVASVGTVLGACGINVAHELGHRFNTFEQVLAQLLLLPSFYMHFFVEHNMGHHKHVATPEDPATSRFNENLYAFWFRSTIYSYISAWKLERFKLNRDKRGFWSVHNRMIQYVVAQTVYLAVVLYFTGVLGLLLFVLVGVFGFLLLETINYIEHYGLVRAKTKSGSYERVKPKHSWNSNHFLGRVVLYELTRHSDHHYIASRKFQILEHHEESPQLPFGYPTSMLMSLLPPLWFRVMNKRIGDSF